MSITKTWKEKEMIHARDIRTDWELYFPTHTWVKNPNNMPGVYKKDGTDFKLGSEEGHNWWCIGSPKAGRFEWRYIKGEVFAYLWLLPNFKVRVAEVDMGWLYQGYLFDTVEDVLLFIYLTNEHDYTDKDMVYAVGKRKYADKLEQLPEPVLELK